MSFGEKLTSFVTGKNKIEREQERAANSQIKKVQASAYYKAREQQAIKVAQAKAQFEAKQQIAKFNRKPQSYSAPIGSGSFGLGGFGSAPSRKKTKRFDVITGRYI